MALPIGVLVQLVPTPDPLHRFEDNRLVSEAHARAFGRYWRENTMWIAPPILLDTALDLNATFSEKYSLGHLTIGTVSIPYDSDHHLRILDGQHRVLGWILAHRDIGVELTKARDVLLGAKQAGSEESVAAYTNKVRELEAESARFMTEHVTVEILVGVTAERHRKFFVDIANNAKGISKSRTASFNQERMMSRIGLHVANKHPLLAGRTDEERDRVTGSARELMSLKTAIELARESTWGLPSRWTDNREQHNDEEILKLLASGFFDTLCESFSELEAVRDGSLMAAQLRDRGLLGSVSMLRILAGVHAAVAVVGTDQNQPRINPRGLEKVKRLFSQLAPEMQFVTAPGGQVRLSQRWTSSAAGRFFPEVNSRGPVARTQDMRAFVELLADWAERGAAFEEARGTAASE